MNDPLYLNIIMKILITVRRIQKKSIREPCTSMSMAGDAMLLSLKMEERSQNQGMWLKKTKKQIHSKSFQKEVQPYQHLLAWRDPWGISK